MRRAAILFAVAAWPLGLHATPGQQDVVYCDCARGTEGALPRFSRAA